MGRRYQAPRRPLQPRTYPHCGANARASGGERAGDARITGEPPMLINCPECTSPVFVRAAAVEQRKPQRCYACKAQLLVDPEGGVEVAVSGQRAAALPSEPVKPPAATPRSPGAAPRPVTAMTTLAPLEAPRHTQPDEALEALESDATAEGPAPVSLASLPPVVPRQASLPDLPLVRDAGEELPYGDAAEALDAAPEEKAPLFAGVELSTDTATMLSPFDRSDEAPAAPSRFDHLPVEDLFDRSGGHLTPATHDDLSTADLTDDTQVDDYVLEHERPRDDLPTATGVPLTSSDEGPPLVQGSLLFDELLLELADEGRQQPPDLAAPARTPPRAEPAPASPASAPAVATQEEETDVVARPAKPRGAVGWLAALALGAGLGGGALFTFPPEPERTPLEQQLQTAADLIGKGRPEDAVPVLEAALREAPDHPLALRRLAIATSLAGDGDSAERLYLRYLERSDDEDDKRQVRALLGLDDSALGNMTR